MRGELEHGTSAGCGARSPTTPWTQCGVSSTDPDLAKLHWAIHAASTRRGSSECWRLAAVATAFPGPDAAGARPSRQGCVGRVAVEAQLAAYRGGPIAADASPEMLRSAYVPQVVAAAGPGYARPIESSREPTGVWGGDSPGYRTHVRYSGLTENSWMLHEVDVNESGIMEDPSACGPIPPEVWLKTGREQPARTPGDSGRVLPSSRTQSSTDGIASPGGLAPPAQRQFDGAAGRYAP